MIKHIVMFKLKDAPEHTAAEAAAAAKERAERLKGVIPSIKEMDVVLNAENADSGNYDIALICLFEDMSGLEEYQIHPEHKKFGEFIGGLRESRACIDFEI